MLDPNLALPRLTDNETKKRKNRPYRTVGMPCYLKLIKAASQNDDQKNEKDQDYSCGSPDASYFTDSSH